VSVPAAERDGDDPGSRLDQAAGHQKVVHAARGTIFFVFHIADAVPGAQTRVFLGKVERLENPA
jgi:hypothetical protein